MLFRSQSDALNVDGTYLIKNGTIIIKYYYTDEVVAVSVAVLVTAVVAFAEPSSFV